MKYTLRPILIPTKYTQKIDKNRSSRFGGVRPQTPWHEIFIYKIYRPTDKILQQDSIYYSVARDPVESQDIKQTADRTSN